MSLNLIPIMTSNAFQVFPCTSVIYTGSRHCCYNRILIDASVLPLKCTTCQVRGLCPSSIPPFLKCDSSMDEHLANNHLLTCNICGLNLFNEYNIRHRVRKHIDQCLNTLQRCPSQPFICMSCFTISWFLLLPVDHSLNDATKSANNGHP